MSIGFKFICQISIGLLFIFQSERLDAQSKVIDKNVSDALNNYLRYSNEIVYELGLLLPEFEAINMSFNQYVDAQQTPTIKVSFTSNLSNYDSLYQLIFQTNRFIEGEQKAKAIDLIQKTKEVSLKIDRLKKNLSVYLSSGEYKTDQHLKKGYDMLRQIEVAYFDIFALKEKLFWNLNALMSSYRDPSNANGFGDIIYELFQCFQQSKRVMSSLRAGDKGELIKEDCLRLRELINNATAKKSSLFTANLNRAELSQLYDQSLKSAEEILKTAQNFIAGNNKYNAMTYSEVYYFYNNELLSIYNRNNGGMTRNYNRMIDQTAAKRLIADEVPPIFEIIYPLHPAFDSIRPAPLPDVEKFMEMLEKKKQDSLRTDSIKIAEAKSLNAFAANNLILLIDISASMNSAEKLPALKKSIDKFLDLLREEDFITVITYSERAEVLIDACSAKNKAQIMDKLNSLNSKTTSNINSGLALSYSNASKSFIKGGNNRLILSTDGNFSINPSLKKLIRKNAKKDIRLTVFYFSEKEFPHVKENLSNVVNLGKGSYYFIGSGQADDALLNEAKAVRK